MLTSKKAASLGTSPSFLRHYIFSFENSACSKVMFIIATVLTFSRHHPHFYIGNLVVLRLTITKIFESRWNCLWRFGANAFFYIQSVRRSEFIIVAFNIGCFATQRPVPKFRRVLFRLTRNGLSQSQYCRRSFPRASGLCQPAEQHPFLHASQACTMPIGLDPVRLTLSQPGISPGQAPRRTRQ